MADKPPVSEKWLAKQRAAKAAEAAFEANQANRAGRQGPAPVPTRPGLTPDQQRRADKHARKQARKKDKPADAASELDAMANALAIDPPGAPSLFERALGFVIGHWKPVLAVALVLAAGGIGFGLCKLTAYRLRTVPGTPIAELFVASPAGDTLLVIDHVAVGGSERNGESSRPTSEGTRLSAIDARTGAKLAVEVDEHTACWTAGTRVWCSDKSEQLHLLDPRTLETLAVADDLIAKAGFAKATRRHQRAGDDVIVVLADGRGAQIAPSTLAVTLLESVPSVPHRFPDDPGCATIGAVAIDAIQLVLRDGGTRSRLTTEPPPPSESPVPVAAALTFLDGAFLRTTPQLPLVLHKDSVDGPAQIARVEGMSKLRWNAGLAGACRRAWISGATLVVATSDRERRALGLDLATGALTWTLAY